MSIFYKYTQRTQKFYKKDTKTSTKKVAIKISIFCKNIFFCIYYKIFLFFIFFYFFSFFVIRKFVVVEPMNVRGNCGYKWFGIYEFLDL